MTFTLRDACELAETVRYKNDVPTSSVGSGNSTEKDRLRRHFTTSSLRVGSQLTPRIADVVKKACAALRVPNKIVHAWVYPSADIQAYCVGSDDKECFVRLSSGVVQLLKEDELAFVVGHEVGHFLLRHNAHEDPPPCNSLEDTILSKSAEISADRLGLIACGELESAVCAMLKTLSGLGGEHINLDIPAFLNELRMISEIRTLEAEIWSSHPPLPLRVKALLWFSMGETFARYTDGDTVGKMKKDELDSRVSNDMEVQFGKLSQQQFEWAEEEVHLWLSAAAVCRDGCLDKTEQDQLNKTLGADSTQKLISFLSMHSADEVHNAILAKLNAACQGYRQLAPKRSKRIIPELVDQVSSRFQQADFEKYIRNHSQQTFSTCRSSKKPSR